MAEKKEVRQLAEMVNRTIRWIGALLTPVVLFTALPAYAAVGARLFFSEKFLGGGVWQYDFTLSNIATEPGLDLYLLSLSLATGGSYDVNSLPSGWDFTAVYDLLNGLLTLDLFSLWPGPPPDGSDIPPGGSLSGFIVRFDTWIGPVPFTATFANPVDPGNPLTFSGNSRSLGYRVYLPTVIK